MSDQSKKMLIGAVISAALAIAVYYGAISQQTASNVQTQANQTLGTGPASQPASTPSQSQTGTTAVPPNPAPQNGAPAPQH